MKARKSVHEISFVLTKEIVEMFHPARRMRDAHQAHAFPCHPEERSDETHPPPVILRSEASRRIS